MQACCGTLYRLIACQPEYACIFSIISVLLYYFSFNFCAFKTVSLCISRLSINYVIKVNLIVMKGSLLNIRYFIGTSGKSSLHLLLLMEHMLSLIDHVYMQTLPLLGSALH